jgi:hypothetical protein
LSFNLKTEVESTSETLRFLKHLDDGQIQGRTIWPDIKNPKKEVNDG